jgi:hypothetical protein
MYCVFMLFVYFGSFGLNSPCIVLVLCLYCSLVHFFAHLTISQFSIFYFLLIFVFDYLSKKFDSWYTPLGYILYSFMFFTLQRYKIYFIFANFTLQNCPFRQFVLFFRQNISLFSCIYAKKAVPSARPFPFRAGSLRRYSRVLRNICKLRIFTTRLVTRPGLIIKEPSSPTYRYEPRKNSGIRGLSLRTEGAFGNAVFKGLHTLSEWL